MRILIGEDEIRQRVNALGQLISADYSGRPLTVLGVLTGSIILLADLIRATTVPLRVALISASSYGGTRTTPGALQINSSLLPDLRGRDVLVLDDIFDTGHTMQGLLAALQEYSPASLRTAVLLWKTERNEVNFGPDYFGFQIPDEFVVGYGLDYNDEYRQLPFIGVPDAADLERAEAGC
jgi:hypoxanthine phosphoribosyltransferase